MIRIEEYRGDCKALKPLVVAWMDEANGKDFGINIDADILVSDLQGMADGEDSTILILIQDEFVIGFMGIVIFDSPLSKDRIANEHYFFVLPKKRGKSSLRLMDEGAKWAKAKSCTHMMMSASNMASDLHDKVCAAYKHKGFKLFESSYIKEL